jgi:hypothetical protein
MKALNTFVTEEILPVSSHCTENHPGDILLGTQLDIPNIDV